MYSLRINFSFTKCLSEYMNRENSDQIEQMHSLTHRLESSVFAYAIMSIIFLISRKDLDNISYLRGIRLILKSVGNKCRNILKV